VEYDLIMKKKITWGIRRGVSNIKDHSGKGLCKKRIEPWNQQKEATAEMEKNEKKRKMRKR